MSVTTESFRETLRAFKDQGDYPDAAIAFYVSLAVTAFTGANSGQGNRIANDPPTLDYATMLFTAHHLVLDKRDEQAADAGGVPGEVEGPATAKSVDKVSYSADTQAVTWDNEAFWNQTRYGIQLINLVRMYGAGGVQVGLPCAGAQFEGEFFGGF